MKPRDHDEGDHDEGDHDDGDAVAALAVYGSLAPGGPNHWVISRLRGEWTTGTVRGYSFELTWGPAEGDTGFLPDPDGHVVDVAVLRSADLDRRWHEIDDFEGDAYDRRPIEVHLDDGATIVADIYVALTDN